MPHYIVFNGFDLYNILYVAILALIVWAVIVIRKKKRYIKKMPWHHFYSDFHLSAQDFYQQVEANVKKRQIPNVNFGRESFFESHIASAKREYLKISRGEWVFYVGASQFGTGTFVVLWACVRRPHFYNNIPFISKWIGLDWQDKTFYQVDTETMYRSAIHDVVTETLDSFTKTKGIRALTELEKQFKV